MNNPQFVQQPCSRCGATVWISPAAGVGYCPSCQTPNQIRPQGAAPAGAPGGAPNAPAPQAQPAAMNPAFAAAMTRRGRPPILPIIGVVALCIVGSIGWIFFKSYFTPGHAKAKDIGITDEKKADLDKMITGTATLAKKWNSDARLYEINIQSFKADGTVDLTKSATLTYWSFGRVKNVSHGTDSVKDFVFNDADINYASKAGLTETQPGFKGMSGIKCTGEKLAKVLKKHDLDSAHLQMDDDMRLDDGPDSGDLVWHVMGDSDTFYVDASSAKCGEVKVEF